MQGCESYSTLYNQNTKKYDLIKEIGNQSNLTRKTTYEIIKNIDDNRIKEFSINPEILIKTLCEIINKNKIEYTKKTFGSLKIKAIAKK